MNFYILDPYKDDDWRLVKDTAGGYGTANDFGNNFLSKNINKMFKRSFLILPILMFCVSCATQTKVSTSLDEQSGIIFEGDLIGTSIEVGSLIFQKIESSDLIIDETRTAFQT